MIMLDVFKMLWNSEQKTFAFWKKSFFEAAILRSFSLPNFFSLPKYFVWPEKTYELT